MGQVLHGSATTTEAIRRAIQHSQESLRALAKRYGINQKTVAKWKKRASVADLPTGPREPRSTVLSPEEEAVIVAFRRYTLLPLDDCLYALQPTIPHLTRSSIASLPAAPRHRPAARCRGRQAGEEEVQGLSDRLLPHRHCRGANRTGQAPHVRRHRPDLEVRLRRAAREGHHSRFQRVPAAPDRSRPLQDPHRSHRQRHPVHHPRRRRIGCAADQGGDRKRRDSSGLMPSNSPAPGTTSNIEPPRPKHPWTNGQVERMNRTIKDATVRRFYYESHDQLRQHLADFVSAYNFGREARRHSKASPPTSSSAKPGLPSPNASL